MLRLWPTVAALLALGTAVSAEYPEIQNYHQTAETETSVTMVWDIDLSEFTPTLYEIIQDNLLTTQFLCSTASCSHIINDLSACSEYTFDLRAVYESDKGPTATATGKTTVNTPASVGNLAQSGDSITWTAPSNAACVDYYEFCYISLVSEINVCTVTFELSYDMAALSGCEQFHITVRGVSADGQKGPVSSIDIVTQYGVPGPPLNYEVSALTESSVFLQWDMPAINPTCVADYAITFGITDPPEKTDPIEKVNSRAGPGNQDFTATLTNLSPCSNYTIMLRAVSITGENGEAVRDYQATNYSIPGEVPGITFVPGQNSINVVWDDLEKETCLDKIEICYTDVVTHEQICIEVIVDPIDRNYTINGLVPCRTYDFIVAGISPIGEFGPPSLGSIETLDVAPGPVRNLVVTALSSTELLLEYDEPIEYPECVQQYIVRYSNKYEATVMDEALVRSQYTDTIGGLDQCALFEVEVSAVSRSGHEGPRSTETAATQEAVPGEPDDPTILAFSDTTITLKWYAPPNRFCVDEYEIRFKPSDGESLHQTVPAFQFPESVTKTFEGLVPCETYELDIRSHSFLASSSGWVEVGIQKMEC